MPEVLNLQDRKYSKRELKRVCRDFGIVGLQEWSFERQGFFVKSVMSEVGAIMARRRGDEVLSFPRVGEVPWLETSVGLGTKGSKKRKARGNERGERLSRVQPRRSAKKRRRRGEVLGDRQRSFTPDASARLGERQDQIVVQEHAKGLAEKLTVRILFL